MYSSLVVGSIKRFNYVNGNEMLRAIYSLGSLIPDSAHWFPSETMRPYSRNRPQKDTYMMFNEDFLSIFTGRKFARSRFT